MDLVIGFLVFTQGHDAIMVFTDQLIKWVKVIVGNKDWSSKEWAYAYYKEAFADMGVSEKTITDKDS